MQVAAGIIGAPPVPKGATAFQYTVNTQGRLTDEAEFGEIVVKTGADGQVTRVRDVARVELAARDYTVNSQLGGKPATAIGIFQRPGSNALETSDAVRTKMDELKQRFPAGLDYTIVYDPTVSVRESIHEVQKTLFEAIALVVLVVLVFLQSWRAIDHPADRDSGLAHRHVRGDVGCSDFRINNLSLFGLVLAIGIVVDDAIVVVENIEHHIANGLSPRDAARKAMDEVSGAVVAVALVLCAVFIPTAFITGITGRILPAVRAHHRRLDRDLRAQFAHAFARARRASCSARTARRRTGSSACSTPCSAGSSAASTKSSPGARMPTATPSRRLTRLAVHRAARLRRPARADRARVQSRARRFPPDAGSRLRASPSRSYPTPPRSIARKPSWTRSRRSRAKRPAFSTRWKSPASISSAATRPTPPRSSCPFKDFAERRSDGRRRCPPSSRRSTRACRAEIPEAFVGVFPPPPVAGIGNAGGYKLYIQDRGNAGLEELQDAGFRA